MFDAQILPAGTAVYSPWFARGGDYARFTVDVIEYSLGGNDLSVQFFTKNSEDTGDGVLASGSPTISRSATGRETAECDNLEELVRYKFTAGGTTGQVLFRMLTPVWFDAVAP